MDTSGDSANCGSCGNSCASAEWCMGSLCRGTYSMCVTREHQWAFSCLSGKVQNWADNATEVSATGVDISNTLGAILVSPGTLWLYYDYYSSSTSCTALPSITVWVGIQSYTTFFPTACCSGSSYITVPIPAGTAWSNIMVVVFSADWGASIRITSTSSS